MKIINSSDKYKFTDKNVVVLGNFDGIHIAHRKIIKQAVQTAKERDLKSLIYLFDKHPITILDKNIPGLLTTFEQKIEIIKELGVDYIFIQVFDEEFSKMEPLNFIEDILCDKLNSAYIITGYDYRFGYKAMGDTNYLKEICEKLNIEVNIVDRIDYKKQPVSASRIRKLIQEGNIPVANELLGRRYSICGVVVHGQSFGKKIGFPTANIEVDSSIQIPASGVYSTDAIIENVHYKSVTNIGIRPTVSNETYDTITCETHIIGYKDLELYGKYIILEFNFLIRKEKKFPNINELQQAINNDILLVKSHDE